MPEPVIISCAITGSIHTPSMTPHLPITGEQIAAEAIAAGEAGAAIVHLHARDPEDGRPASDPDLFQHFLPEISERSDAVINISTGGGHRMTLDERLAAARRFEPELCSLNMGSINFGLYPSLERMSNFKYDWEPEYLEKSRDFIFRNTFADIEAVVSDLGARGTRFEFECYDVGHLYNLAHFLDRGIVEPPLFIQAVFGILGGMGPDPENVLFVKSTADRLFGDSHRLSVLAAGRHQTNLVTLNALLGGHARVGIEDSIYLEKGRLAESNAQQVAKLRHILEELSMQIATPDEVRGMLALKGRDHTAIARA